MANSSKTPIKRVISTEVEGTVTEWCVQIYLNSSEEIGILFDLFNGTEVKKHVCCNFYLVDTNKNLVFVARKIQRSYGPIFPIVGRKIFAKSSYYRLEKTDKLVPNDTMTLYIELITYLDDNPTFPYEDAGYHVNIEDNLPQIFLELYDDHRNDNGDINIQVKDIQFKVHRVVLETRCSTLYEDVARHQQTPEGTEFNIMGIDPEIFKRLLEFLYTGQIKDLDDHSEYLLEAADRYKLKRLKQLCEKSLIDNYLTDDNYKELQDLAVRCHAHQLGNNVGSFGRKFFPMSEVVATSDNSCTVTIRPEVWDLLKLPSPQLLIRSNK